MLSKLLLTISILGFFGVGLLLFTNHPGFAIKTSNYLFFILIAGVIASEVKYEK